MAGIEDYVILIPSLNPDEALLRLVEELRSIRFCKFVLVDDGSSIGSEAIWKALGEIPGVMIVRHAVNLGKGRALKTGINQAMISFPGSAVVTVDGDGQHKAEDILSCVQKSIEENGEVIILGVRSFSNKEIPLRSRFGNKLTRGVMRLCGIRLSDTQTGLRILPASILEEALHIEGERYEYETNELLTWEDRRGRFIEVPITTIYENNNEVSHFHPIRDSIKIYGTILRYGFSSIIATLIDNLVFICLLPYISNYWALTYIGRACSMLVNFGMNKRLVFRDGGSQKEMMIQFIEYVVLVLVSGFLSGLAITWLSNVTDLSIILLKIIIETMLYFFNYFVQRELIFRRR